jgi:hypothetical protein
MKVIPNFRPNPAKFVAFLAAMRTEVLILFARSFGVLLVLSVCSGCLVERLDGPKLQDEGRVDFI